MKKKFEDSRDTLSSNVKQELPQAFNAPKKMNHINNIENLEELKQKVNSCPDFIYNPQFDNSLKKLETENDKKFSDHAISKMLLMGQDEVDSIYQNIIKKAKKFFLRN